MSFVEKIKSRSKEFGFRVASLTPGPDCIVSVADGCTVRAARTEALRRMGFVGPEEISKFVLVNTELRPIDLEQTLAESGLTNFILLKKE